MPRLIFVNFNDGYFWTHRSDLALSLVERGWDVYVTTGGHDEANTKKLKEAGLIPLTIPAYKGILNLRTIPRIMWALRKNLKEIRPDIIHAITIKYAFLTGLSTLFLKNIRLVYTIAGLGYLFSNENLRARMMRFALMPVLLIAFKRRNILQIFQNSDDKARFIQYGLTKERYSALIRGSGVNTQKFIFVREPEKEIPVVLMATRLIREKGVEIFIQTARIVKERGYQAHFVLAGGTDAYNPSALKEEDMEKLLKDSDVKWRGKIEDMPRMFQRAHIIAYPSFYMEGVPKVLLEAAASGRAIVTTDHPGCKEVVQENVNGHLVPIKDPKATATAVIDLLEHPDKRQEMGQRNREIALKEFDVSIVNRKTRQLYDRVLSTSQKKQSAS